MRVPPAERRTPPNRGEVATAAAAAEAAQVDHPSALAWSWLDGFVACARWVTGERPLPSKIRP